MTLHLRIPGWCQDAKLRLNGVACRELGTNKGYATLMRKWRNGDVVELDLPMPVLLMEANPLVKYDTGKVAIQRGPIVYGLEGLDNDGSPDLTLGEDPRLTPEHRKDFLGGLTVIRGVSSTDKPFMAIPFFALANREPSRQEVWLTQSRKQDDPLGWQGLLYRPYQPNKSTPDQR
jgi:DUF1680 family protein